MIDLGPEGGDAGGEIVADRHARSRSPASPTSYTGRFLRGLVEAEEPAPKPRRSASA